MGPRLLSRCVIVADVSSLSPRATLSRRLGAGRCGVAIYAGLAGL